MSCITAAASTCCCTTLLLRNFKGTSLFLMPLRSSGATALHAAAVKNSADMVQLLLQHGAAVDQKQKCVLHLHAAALERQLTSALCWRCLPA